MPEKTDNPASATALPAEGSGGTPDADIEIPGKGPSGKLNGFSFDASSEPPRKSSAVLDLSGVKHVQGPSTAPPPAPENTQKDEQEEPPPLALDIPHPFTKRILNPREVLEEKLKKVRDSEFELERALERTQFLKKLEKHKFLLSLKAKTLPALFGLAVLLVIAGIVVLTINSNREEQKRKEEAAKREARLKKEKEAAKNPPKRMEPKPAKASPKPEEPKAAAAPQPNERKDPPPPVQPDRNDKPAAAVPTDAPATAKAKTVQESGNGRASRNAKDSIPQPPAADAASLLEIQISEAKALAYEKMKSSDPEQAVLDLNDTLKKLGLRGAKLAVNVVKAAQTLPDPAFSQICLDAMAKDPSCAMQWSLYRLRHKMLYDGELPAAHELDSLPGNAAGRELRMISLIAIGDYDKALQTPVPNDEAPDFWKTFLQWRQNLGDWQPDAQKLAFKESSCGNSGKCIAARLWLGSVKYEDARTLSASLPNQEAPILRLMLAEYSKKTGNAIASQIMYTKALNAKPNLYKRMIEHLRDN